VRDYREGRGQKKKSKRLRWAPDGLKRKGLGLRKEKREMGGVI